MTADKKKDAKKGGKKGRKKPPRGAPQAEMPVAIERASRRNGNAERAMLPIRQPAANTRSVFRSPSGASGRPLASGGGATNYTCGACGSRLLSSVQPGAHAGVVFVCPSCGSFNEVPG